MWPYSTRSSCAHLISGRGFEIRSTIETINQNLLLELIGRRPNLGSACVLACDSGLYFCVCLWHCSCSACSRCLCFCFHNSVYAWSVKFHKGTLGGQSELSAVELPLGSNSFCSSWLLTKAVRLEKQLCQITYLPQAAPAAATARQNSLPPTGRRCASATYSSLAFIALACPVRLSGSRRGTAHG